MSRLTAALVMGGLCLISASCDRIEKQRKEKEALRDIEASRSEMIDSAKMTDEGMVVDMEKVRKSQQTLKESGEKMGGGMGEALKISAELQGSLNEAAEKCIKAADDAALALDLESLSENRDYEAAIAKFETLILVNKDALELFRAFRPNLTKRLDEIGFTGPDRKGFNEGFDEKWPKTIELVETVRNADIKTGEIGILIMKGLRKGDAHWTWDETQAQATFQTDEQVEWYNKHIEKIQELGEAQIKAQQELLEHMKNPG